MKKQILFALLLLAGGAVDTHAQTPPNPPPSSYYPPAAVTPASLSVTSSSARVVLPALPSAYPAITIVNNGPSEIFCRAGDATVTATTSAYTVAVPSGGYRGMWNSTATYVACVTSSSTATARITQSNGAAQLGFNSVPASLPPSGAAGGDLAGTYPNPTVGNLSNVTNGSLANSGLANSSVTIAGHAVSLGGTQAVACADLSNGATGCSTATGTSGATIPLLNGVNTWSGNQTVSGANFGLTGNITGAGIFGTSGIRYKNVAGTLSDTTSTGTVATNYDSKFGGNTLTATSATTITNNYGSYFTAPVCSTNVTCTNNYALGADSLNVAGAALISGTLNLGGVIADTNAGTSTFLGSIGMGGTTAATGAVYLYRGTDNASIELYNTGQLGWSPTSSPTATADLLMVRKGAASLQFGNVDAAAPVAQTVGPQSVIAGTSNTAGSAFTIHNSAGTGTGVGGNIIFQYAPHGSTGTAQNAFATALTINGDTGGLTAVASGAFASFVSAQAIRDTTTSQAIDLTTSSYVDILGAHPNLRTLGALVAGGSAPTITGTGTFGAQTGGNTAGTFVATMTAQTAILTFSTTAPTGWNCNAHDRTTPADSLNQTASSTTSCTLTGTTAASDVISFDARAY